MTQATHKANPYEMHPLEAWRALKVLLADPEDTSQVFKIVRALSGKSVLRGYNRFTRTTTGQQVLAEERELLTKLQDRDWLRTLPADSLGRKYLGFVERENISAEGLVDASVEEQIEESDPNIQRYANRLRDSHDLWHVLTNYGRDLSGEACLLGFTVAQTKNPGLALIALIGALKIARETDRRILPALVAAVRAGFRANWLPAADWETLLARPYDEVRAELGIEEPKIYPEMVPQQAVA